MTYCSAATGIPISPWDINTPGLPHHASTTSASCLSQFLLLGGDVSTPPSGGTTFTRGDARWQSRDYSDHSPGLPFAQLPSQLNWCVCAYRVTEYCCGNKTAMPGCPRSR